MKLEIRHSFGIIPNYQYDLIFSGHTMTCVLSIFCVSNIYSYYITLILSIICSFFLITTKEHYTIDVIIAWIATKSIVSLYS